ncbi:hypothetical protein Verru16b_01951 [Lacunisphaera limnophila]|uniref:Uncharacterized protein n=1 Tax=Lacunisphaera limnophila TaxID=1838286 RepID=A0A1D8AVH0_9BACT|nr:hypothetical protein [Lacunisphaera limnophila]AOS44882.1 hypothetical protein Verru16b_01951 [Lacunisphaera limnophila]
MKTTFLPSRLIGVLTSLLVLATLGRANDDYSVLTSVMAKTAKDYKRVKGPDGKWEREYYTLVNGGPAEGTIRDSAQGRVPFVALATVLAQHLARQGYYPAASADQVDHLLVVNWGQTRPFADAVYRDGLDNVVDAMNMMSLKNQASLAANANAGTQTQSEMTLTGSVEDMEAEAADSYLQNAMIIQDMNNRARNQSNARTAHLLGYMGNINQADGPQRYAGGGDLYNELIADIEEARYYIILSAYDFDRTVRQQRPKLQWVTRMSMRAPGNSFAEKAAAMIAYSSSRFGQNTSGLERKLYPQYKVNLEDTRFLGMASTWRNPADAAPESKQ